MCSAVLLLVHFTAFTSVSGRPDREQAALGPLGPRAAEASIRAVLD